MALLSPGIQIKETDLSQVVAVESSSTAVFGGNFVKGPIGFHLLIDSVAALKDHYGMPNKYNYNDWMQCWNFLQYGNTLLVSRAANLNGNLVKTDLKFDSDQFKLNDIKDKKTIIFYKQSGTELTLARTDIFEVGTKVSFMENPKVYTVKNKRDDNVEVTITKPDPDHEGQVLTTQENKDVTIITLDVAPEVDASVTYLYTITTPPQPAGNKISLKGNNNLKIGDIFGLSDNLTDPLFRILGLEEVIYQGEYFTNIFYIGKDDDDQLVNASKGTPLFKLDRTESACTEIPSTFRKFNPNLYDSVEHTVPNYTVFDELQTSLPFVNNDAILKFFARTPGEWGNSIDIAIANPDDFGQSKELIEGIALDDVFEFLPYGDQFAVIVIYNKEVVEKYIVSLNEEARNDNNESIYIENIINKKSNFVLVNINNANPEKKVSTMLGENVAKLTAGDNSNPGKDDINAAYELFDNKEEIDVDIIIANEFHPEAATNLAIKRADCIAFVGCPKHASVGLKAANALKETLEYRKNLNINSSFCALFSNYKYQYCNELDKYVWINVAGDVAGLKAQTNYNRDLWFAAAGLERGQIKNCAKLATSWTNTQRDSLYKNNINPIVTFPNQGTVLWGQKTLQTKESSFNRINVRALFNHLERSLGKMAKYSLFEFNDSFTRNYLVSIIKPFLGMVKAGRGIQDYLVICDESNNTPQIVANNQLVCDIYIKPTYVAEYILLHFVNTGTQDFSIAISKA